MEPQHIDPIIGRQWGNYHVTERIGAGGMGAVYRMHHKSLPSLKAIKVLHQTVGLDVQRRFQQEALAASAVDSEKIVSVDDVGEWPDGIHYIVMELIDGRSLADDFDEKTCLPLETALKLLYRLADTLALVHAKGIVHRDLKPQNILLPRDTYAPKICDFGIASVASAAPSLKVRPTQERVISGSPGYRSPEQLAALATDGRSDIYSLGVIGFEALTGELPHAPIVHYDPVAAAKFFTRPVPTVASLRPPALPPVPAIVEEVIARALAMDVSRRYTTATEFRDALGLCLKSLGDPSDGLIHNRMLTMITTAADANAPAPALRTPDGEIDRMIARLKSKADVPTLADVTAPKTNAPTPIADETTLRAAHALPSTPATLTAKDIESIFRIIRRRVGIRSADHPDTALNSRQLATWAFLQTFAQKARESSAAQLFNAAVPFHLLANLLIDLPSDEVALIAGMLRAVRDGRDALRDWLAANWE